jgi:anti-anti-sigma factor
MSDLANLAVARREGVAIATITGEIDVSNADGLELALLEEIGDAAGLVVDLSRLKFMDSSGLHMLFALEQRLHYRRLGFAVVLTDESLPRRVFVLSGPRPITWIHANQDDAVASVLASA